MTATEISGTGGPTGTANQGVATDGAVTASDGTVLDDTTGGTVAGAATGASAAALAFGAGDAADALTGLGGAFPDAAVAELIQTRVERVFGFGQDASFGQALLSFLAFLLRAV